MCHGWRTARSAKQANHRLLTGERHGGMRPTVQTAISLPEARPDEEGRQGKLGTRDKARGGPSHEKWIE